MMRWRHATMTAAAVVCTGAAAVGVHGAVRPKSRTQANCASSASTSVAYDVAVIGGGVVGLAVAREMAVRGRTVVLLEREDAPAAGASSGNSGIGCTGYDAPAGSLERRLLRRAIQLHPALLRSFGMSYEHVRKCGSLVVAWTAEELAELPRIVAQNREAGDLEVVQLSAAELHELEPSLSAEALGAVFCPREAVVEPWLVPAGYAHSAKINGAELRMSREVTAVDYCATKQLWHLRIRHTTFASSGRSAPGTLLVPRPEPKSRVTVPQGDETVTARAVVNCAGLFGDTVEQMRVRSSSTGSSDGGFTVTPRKGQFIVFSPPSTLHGDSGDGNDKDVVAGSRPPAPVHIIEPVPTQFTKGVIVFTTVYGNVVVGPTAVDQPDKEDRSTDFRTVRELRAWGERVCPALKHAVVLGTYSGLRPATEHRDYQIRVQGNNWLTVAGIRSTGLTASAAIAEYVADLHHGATDASTTAVANSEASLARVTTAATSPLPLQHTPSRVLRADGTVQSLPTLSDLAAQYQRRGDGKVVLYPGADAVRVTHCLSAYGMESLAQGGG